VGALTLIGVLVYLGIGFVQFLAIITGVQDWWGIHWLLSGFIALFLAYMPVIGTITGIMGAIKAWNWSYTVAILFFCCQSNEARMGGTF